MSEIQVIGNKFRADFGQYVFELNFESETELGFRYLKGGENDDVEKVSINKVEIRPNVYMVSGQEKTGTSVVHVEDFENEIVYSNITLPDNTFINLKGTLTKI